MKQFGVLWAGDAEIVDDWLPEAIADLIDPRLGARFVEIATGRTTDADRGNEKGRAPTRPSLFSCCF